MTDDEDTLKCDQCDDDGILFGAPCYFCQALPLDEYDCMACKDSEVIIVNGHEEPCAACSTATSQTYEEWIADQMGVNKEDLDLEYDHKTESWYPAGTDLNKPMTPEQEKELKEIVKHLFKDLKEQVEMDVPAGDGEEWPTDGDEVEMPPGVPSILAHAYKKKKKPKKITLGDKQAEFLNLSQIMGPEDEEFQDPDWQHCHNESCESCNKHALHHGIKHSNQNPDGKKISIWQQCLNKHGKHDIFGNKITVADLKAYLHPKGTGVSITPIQQQQIDSMAQYNATGIANQQQPMKTKEKKKMKYTIGAKLRAKRILKIVERFDISWREKGEEGFFNVLRCSPIYLRQFLGVFMKNLLKKEAIKIFKMEMDRLDNSLGEISSRTTIEEMVEDYYAGLSKEQKTHSLDVISNLMAEMLNDVIDAHLTSGNNMGDVHRFKDSPGTDPRDVMNLYINRGNSGVLDSVFLKAYLTYDNDEGTTLPLSQKARGIHAIGRNTTGLAMFDKLPSLHISLDAANNGTNRELIMSISRAWMNTRAENTLSKGLYIRTCPETPRPGALPNVEAKTPRQFLDGVRMLGACMTDPNHIDYDPNGCLVVQQFITAICSAVVVKGSNTFTIGPSNDGVTAGGGSNITFTLNPRGARDMERDMRRLSLEDGMEHHEIELVYDSHGGTHKALSWFKRLADQRHRGKEGRLKPTITQMRGLYTAKPDLLPPPIVNGELLHIRGLVPMGSIEQLESMDVGKGSLDECIELEQMAKKGELPEGLVVYAPSGTNAAHVAGVAGDFGFPAIFGIKPQKNHTVWTEIKGWVTTMRGAEPEPYDPTPMLDFYKIGLRDGDRFWTYNLAPLSQFFHNFISGPVNDPRLEAYLAGVYTTWIIKAALGVSMAEFRHGIGSSRANINPQRAFSHILLQQSIAGESGVNNLFSRSEYYQRLNYNELGYDMIDAIANFYSDAYDENIVTWSDGSFGGEKYYSATYPTRDASSMILRMLQGKEVSFRSLLNSVNQLENAVHNTGFFFNKFLGDKNAFDIGTTGHRNFASACEHWLVTAPFYALFYTNYVNEPHRVAKGHDKLIAHLYGKEEKGARGKVEMREKISEFVSFASVVGTLKDDVESHSLEEHEHFYIHQLIGGYNMHKNGMCGYTECTSPECKQAGILVAMGINEKVLERLLNQLNYFMEWPALAFTHAPDTLETVTDALTAQGSRAASATAFTKKEREVNTPEVAVEKIGNQNGYDFPVWSIKSNNSDTKWIYIDQLLTNWWGEMDDTISELENENMVSQYEAWREPTDWVGEDIMDEMRGLDQILQGEGEYRIYSRYWSTACKQYRTPLGLIKSMMVAHEGRYQYNTHSLLKELHEAGKINENEGEIK